MYFETIKVVLPPVFACPPFDATGLPWTTELRDIYEGITRNPSYFTVISCQYCGREMFIGQEQQSMRTTRPNTRVLCFWCANDEMSKLTAIRDARPGHTVINQKVTNLYIDNPGEN